MPYPAAKAITNEKQINNTYPNAAAAIYQMNFRVAKIPERIYPTIEFTIVITDP